jgi:hypothetical protein
MEVNHKHDLFFKDHLEIQQLLKELESQLRLTSPTERFLKQIQWLLERHFYLEEKLICTNVKVQKTLGQEKIKQMQKEHDLINNLLQEIMSLSLEEKEAKLHDFSRMVKKHYRFEINEIYRNIYDLMGNAEYEIIEKKLKKEITLGFYPIKKIRGEEKI